MQQNQEISLKKIDSKEEAKRSGSSDAGKGNSGENKEKKKNRALGTCHYMAPEVINGEENTRSLDYWSLGVIVFEFLTGGLPFQADSPIEVFARIKARDIKYPPIGRGENEMTPEAHDLIENLLNPNPRQRLGYKNINEIKQHPFFKSIDWDHIMDMEAPFKPGGREQDATYFPKANEQDEDLQIIINDKRSMERQDNKDFNKFDAVCYDTLQSINQKEA